jgi:hypothetical protein
MLSLILIAMEFKIEKAGETHPDRGAGRKT